uniref:Uncharacterized protein n=1 Tax=Romanomermis culicivorax TaxID=13658 RepID=A0A915KHK5_ROMCU
MDAKFSHDRMDRALSPPFWPIPPVVQILQHLFRVQVPDPLVMPLKIARLFNTAMLEKRIRRLLAKNDLNGRNEVILGQKPSALRIVNSALQNLVGATLPQYKLVSSQKEDFGVEQSLPSAANTF